MSNWPFFVLGIVLLTVVAPMWIRHHYQARLAGEQARRGEDARTINELKALADRLENRVATLERVLDAEAPDWRKRA